MPPKINVPKSSPKLPSKSTSSGHINSSRPANQTPDKANRSNADHSSKNKSKDPAKKGADDKSVKSRVDDIADKAKKAKDDPTQLAADLADEYLHLGTAMGTTLWYVWFASAVVSLFPFVVTAIPGAIMFNLLLISPKLNYQITVWILDLVGIGEALQAANQMGLDKVDIKVAGWQKGFIIAYDVVLVVLLVSVAALVIALIGWWVCGENSFVPGTSGSLQQQGSLKLYDWWYDTNYSGAVNDMCKAIRSSVGS